MLAKISQWQAGCRSSRLVNLGQHDIVPHETSGGSGRSSWRARSKGAEVVRRLPRAALDHASDGVEPVRGVDDQATEC